MTTDERLSQLATARAARQDELDLPRTMTQREVNAYLAETATLDKRIRAIQTAADTLAALPTLDADTTWLDHLNTWRKVLCDELLTIKSPIRDRTIKERADRLDFCIRLIDHGLGVSTLGIVTLASSPIGPLMAAAGYETEGTALRGPRGFLGGIKEVEKRIKDTTKQRATAQAALDVLLRTDEERATQDVEDVVFYATMKTMNCRVSSDGKSLVATTLDGDELPVSDMTEQQRAAFARHEAAHFGRPREAFTT